MAGLLVLLVCSVFASAALAASGTSAADQYESTKAVKPATVVKAAVATSSTPKATTTSSGDLPFTGLSLVSIVVIGGALVAVGFVLRRRNVRDEL